MSTQDDNFNLALLFGTGAYLFIKGFTIFRESHVLADTPRIAIRSAAMGLVDIRGRAVGDNFLISPIMRAPCYYYKSVFEQWSVDKYGNGKWLKCHTEEDQKEFYLQDSTGKVLVEPWGADLDLAMTLYRDVMGVVPIPPPSSATAPIKEGARPTDVQLLDALAQVSQRSSGLLNYTVHFFAQDSRRMRVAKAKKAHGGNLDFAKLIAAGGRPSFDRAGGAGKFRLRETCILRGYDYDITGTCVENRKPKDENDHNKITQGENEATFTISSCTEKEEVRRLRKKAFRYIFGGAALLIIVLALFLNLHHWL